MNFLGASVSKIAQDIWLSVLSEPIYPKETKDSGHLALTSWVRITGPWQGVVALEFSEALAKKAAAVMFQLEEDKVSSIQMLDAIEELANMAGGNLKGILTGPSHLSLPSVGEGGKSHFPAGNVACRLEFTCAGEPGTLTVYEK